jgi:hypothetical protein
MSLVKPTNTIYINYTNQISKPAGGFRLYYRPATSGTTLSHAEPSIPIGYYDQPGIVEDNTTLHRIKVKLPFLLPLIEITAGAPSRTLYIGVAPVDANGNVGDITTPVTITLNAPTFPVTYTIT